MIGALVMVTEYKPALSVQVQTGGKAATGRLFDTAKNVLELLLQPYHRSALVAPQFAKVLLAKVGQLRKRQRWAG